MIFVFAEEFVRLISRFAKKRENQQEQDDSQFYKKSGEQPSDFFGNNFAHVPKDAEEESARHRFFYAHRKLKPLILDVSPIQGRDRHASENQRYAQGLDFRKPLPHEEKSKQHGEHRPKIHDGGNDGDVADFKSPEKEQITSRIKNRRQGEQENGQRRKVEARCKNKGEQKNRTQTRQLRPKQRFERSDLFCKHAAEKIVKSPAEHSSNSEQDTDEGCIHNVASRRNQTTVIARRAHFPTKQSARHGEGLLREERPRNDDTIFVVNIVIER